MSGDGEKGRERASLQLQRQQTEFLSPREIKKHESNNENVCGEIPAEPELSKRHDNTHTHTHAVRTRTKVFQDVLRLL